MRTSTHNRKPDQRKFEMPKYQLGDIVCSTTMEALGQYRAKVVVKGNFFDDRQEHIYESTEAYLDKEDAMRDATAYVQKNFPPE